MRRKTMTVVVALVATVLFAEIAASQGMPRVYVGHSGGSSGFTAGEDVGDSEMDLIKDLRKKDNLVVVTSDEDADVVIRVLERHEDKSVGSFTTYDRHKDDDHRTSTTYANQTTTRVVQAKLVVDDFELDLRGEGFLWSSAADDIGDQVEDWIKDNYARLMDRREERRASRPAAPPAASSADATPAAASTSDASIEPGMSPEDVEAEMGAPLRKVTFGTKTLWRYDGLEVVFEDGEVSDVKF